MVAIRETRMCRSRRLIHVMGFPAFGRLFILGSQLLDMEREANRYIVNQTGNKFHLDACIKSGY